MRVTGASPSFTVSTQLLSEPGLGHLRRFTTRRLALVTICAALGALWAFYLARLDSEPLIALLPTAFIVALLLFVSSTTILRLSSALELGLVRSVARSSSKMHFVVLGFALYSISLGLLLQPLALQRKDALIAVLLTWLAAGPLLKHFRRSMFAANVKGPSAVGMSSAVLTVAMPMGLYTTAIVTQNALFGVAAIAYGIRCVATYTWIMIAAGVESTQAVPNPCPTQRSANRGILLKVVRYTEECFNQGLIERSAAWYGLCHLLYFMGGCTNRSFREAFRSLRVQRLFSARRYHRVVKRTKRNSSGVMRYLRAQALIRIGDLAEARVALAERPGDASNPYILLAKSHLALEEDGFFSPGYRSLIQQAADAAKARIAKKSIGGYVCPEAIAEHAKATAFAAAIQTSNSRSDVGRVCFIRELMDVQDARHIADKYSAKLSSEIRGVEGVIHALAGDYLEAYKAFIEALSTGGENLKVRYYLSTLLAVGSISFARPVYHLERIISLVPKRSRLGRLAAVRLGEILEIIRINKELSSSWEVFRLLTLQHSYLSMAENVESHLPFALAYREDEKKRRAHGVIFGRQLSSPNALPDWAAPLRHLRKSRIEEGQNEEAKHWTPITPLS